jgi:tRNA(fMet)-specific endonuclease VapC
MFLLDTNIISYWMRNDLIVIGNIENHAPAELAMPAISLAEILYGIEKSPVRKRERTTKIRRIAEQMEIIPFDKRSAPKYAKIRATLEKAGRMIGERDMQIAAIAIATHRVMVTHNVSEFQRIEKLRVEDWAGGKMI